MRTKESEIEITKLFNNKTKFTKNQLTEQYIFEEVYKPKNQEKRPMDLNHSKHSRPNWRHLNLDLSHKWITTKPIDSIFLDLGAGPLTHKKLFAGRKVVYADGASFEGVHVVTNFEKPLPFTSNAFRYIHCSNVLEHMKEPQHVLNEIYRCLDKSGEALIIVPFFIKEHQCPLDFFRYTRYGLSLLASNAGFENISIQNVGSLDNIKLNMNALEIRHSTSIFERLFLRLERLALIAKRLLLGERHVAELPQGFSVYLKK